MNKRRSNRQPNQAFSGAPRMGRATAHTRLLPSILCLEHPILLVGLPEALVLDALAGGLQADVCDHSLESLGRLARGCLAYGLQVTLYWQPLVSLSLPVLYATIVLAPRSWQALSQQADTKAVEQHLQSQLRAGGQLKLLLTQTASLESMAV